MKYGKLLVLFACAAVLACALLASCKSQSPAEPGVTVKHDGQSAEIIFSGYGAQVRYGAMSVLPLTDGSFLVGVVTYGGVEGAMPIDPAPRFFLFDSGWGFVAEVPFDAEEFLSGEEARGHYAGDPAYMDYAENKIALGYEFKINTVTPDSATESATEGRLQIAPTDYGVVTQIIDFTGAGTTQLALAKCYYYDYDSGTVRLKDMYQLDGGLAAEVGRLDLVAVGDSHLLYGTREVDGSTESFFVLFNKNSALRDDRAGFDKFSYEKMAVWQGADKCLIGPPFSERYPSPEFKLFYSNGRVTFFEIVPLPEGYELGACRYNEDSGALEFLLSDGRAAMLDADGDWAEIESIKPALPSSSGFYDYRFTAEEAPGGIGLKAVHSPYSGPGLSPFYSYIE